MDSSAIVYLALDDEKKTPKILQILKDYEHSISSELCVVESQAGLSSHGFPQKVELVDAEENLNNILARLLIFAVDSRVLGMARSLVRQYRASIGLRSLDAIHLATTNIVRDLSASDPRFSLKYLTGDHRQHQAFVAEGYTGYLL